MYNQFLLATTLAAGLVFADPVAARLTGITFSGQGRVTHSSPGEYVPNPPLAGTPVSVVGTLTFSDGKLAGGDAVVPNDFTGDVVFGIDNDSMAGRNLFSYQIVGAEIYGRNFDEAGAGGFATLRKGKLVALYLVTVIDPAYTDLFTDRFEIYWNDSTSQWGGVWSLTDAVTSSIPDAPTWTTMILGFGLAGAAARRRRVAVKT